MAAGPANGPDPIDTIENSSLRSKSVQIVTVYEEFYKIVVKTAGAAAILVTSLASSCICKVRRRLSICTFSNRSESQKSRRISMKGWETMKNRIMKGIGIVRKTGSITIVGVCAGNVPR